MGYYDDNNIICAKSKAFAIRCVNLYKYLSTDFNEYVLSKQLLRSGTSIGANVREGTRAQSYADFISKMNIALKEACETQYWLEILVETKYLDELKFQNIYDDCTELVKMLTAIIKTSRSKAIEK